MRDAIAHLDFIEDKLSMQAYRSVAFLAYMVSKAAFSTQSDVAPASDEEFLVRFKTAHD